MKVTLVFSDHWQHFNQCLRVALTTRSTALPLPVSIHNELKVSVTCECQRSCCQVKVNGKKNWSRHVIEGPENKYRSHMCVTLYVCVCVCSGGRSEWWMTFESRTVTMEQIKPEAVLSTLWLCAQLMRFNFNTKYVLRSTSDIGSTESECKQVT